MLCHDAKYFHGETGSRLELFGHLQPIEATQAPDIGRRGQASVSNAVRVVEVLPARILLSDGLKGFTGLCANAQIVPSSFESAGTPVTLSTSSASGEASGVAASASSSEFVAVESVFVIPAPFHDRTVAVTMCGRVCFGSRKINLSTVFAGQNVAVKEVAGKVWLISFMRYDLGFFDHETTRFECAESPFAAEPSTPAL
jgi:hypothetical protein